MELIQEIKVLLIEDNPGDARLITEIIKEITEEKIELIHAGRLSEGLKILRKTNIDLILLDLILPDGYSLDSLQKIKNEFKSIPIIIISGITDKEMAAKAIEIGAQEFIIKMPFEPDLFSRSIRYSIIRQKKEENLRKTTQLLDTIVDNTDTNLAILDINFNYVFVNKSYAQSEHEPQSFFLGKNLLDLYKSPGLREIFLEVLKTKKPVYKYSSPFIYQKKLRSEIEYWDWSLTPIINEDGKVTSLLFSAKNVTMKAENEKKLSFQALLLNTVNDAIYSIDTDANITSWNKASEIMFGWKADEVIGKKIYEVFNSSFSVKETINSIEEINKTGYYSSEFSMKRKDNSDIIIESACIYLKDNNRKITGYATVNHDITKRKLAEMQLMRERDKFRQILDSSLMFAVEISPDQNVLFLNKRACEILECSPNEFIGKNWFDNFLPAKIREDIRIKFIEMVSRNSKAMLKHKNPVISKNGNIKMISWHNIPITDGDNFVNSVFSTGIEISE